MARLTMSSGWALVLATAALVATSGGTADGQGRAGRARWIAAWATSQQALGAAGLSNATVRMIARVTIPGEQVRVRFDNAYGTAPLQVGRATLALRRGGAALVPGSLKRLSFAGAGQATIPAGGSIVSDAVPLPVRARQDLAVSFHIPESDVRPSQHTNGLVTSFLTADGAGDLTEDESATPFVNRTTAALWLKSVDVFSSQASGGIVAFGDSITDGSCATPDAYERWPDLLAQRLELDGRVVAVVNEGIGGNTVLPKHPDPIPPTGMAALDRLDRDVLAHPGMTHVVLFIGTNDLRRNATPAMVSEGLDTLARRVKAKGLKVIGATLIPRHNNTGQTPWDPTKTARRNELNVWIRSKAPFDAVLDFDKVVRDRASTDLIEPVFDCDGIHPSPRGYYEMAKSVKLSLFGG
jgi:lysophospholipase L1-like esterase